MANPRPDPAHRLSFGHLEQLTAHLLDGVILIDPAGMILSANTAALRMHGVESLDQLGATAEEYAERFTLFSTDGGVLKRREYPLFRLLAGDSFPDLVVEVAPAGEHEARWVHQVRDVAMNEDGDEPECLALVINDLSAQFDAEARFRAMFQANPAPALIVRLSDQRIIEANPGFLSLTGFAAKQLVGRTPFGLDLLQDLAEPAAIRKKLEAGEIIEQTEAELLTGDGSRRLVIFAGQPIDVTSDDAILLTFADLEPRRRSQDALAATERQASAVFEMAPVAMIVTQADRRITAVNSAFCQLTGRSEEESVGSTADTLSLWDRSEDRALLESEVEADGGVRNRDVRILSKQNEPIDCLVSAETISVQGTLCTLWLYQDITERRRSETELVEAIDAVMKDATWLSRSIIDKLATIRRPGTAAPMAELSTREREILELICDDLENQAIAERLGLSPNTVRNHVARLYAKIGVNRRSGAVVWGRERGVGLRKD